MFILKFVTSCDETLFSVNLSRKFFQSFSAIRKTSACLLVSCNTSWGLSIQQSQAESFIKLESYKEDAQCESEQVVANSRVACWLFEALLNSGPSVGRPRQRRQTQGTFKCYNSILFIYGPPWLFSWREGQSAVMFLSVAENVMLNQEI